MDILLKVIIGFFSTFLVAAILHGLFLVGGWWFPFLCIAIGVADYSLIKKVFFKN